MVRSAFAPEQAELREAVANGAKIKARHRTMPCIAGRTMRPTTGPNILRDAAYAAPQDEE
jgi:hypothetical protein